MGALAATGLKLPVVYVALLGKTQDFPPYGLSFHVLEFVDFFFFPLKCCLCLKLIPYLVEAGRN